MNMSTVVFTYDVFLSYSLADKESAKNVKLSLHEAGLDIIDHEDIISRGDDLQDTLWKSLAESDAVVVVVNPAGPIASNIGVEVGAALAWHKPIYVIQTDIRGTGLPLYLSGFPIYPITRIDDLAFKLKSDLKPLSDEDRNNLAKAYSQLGIPVDKLLQNPYEIERLATLFKQDSGRQASGERLMQELVRMRKSGLLSPRHR
jgi:hypothetical protein